MNASEFTEPFDLERWAAGEPVYSMISERFLHFSHIEGVFYMAKEGGVNIKAGTQPTKWRMKPKASDDGWIKHDGGPCPIPWAKAKEWEWMLSEHAGGRRAGIDAVDDRYWSLIINYRLANGWIKCDGKSIPQSLEPNKGEGYIEFITGQGKRESGKLIRFTHWFCHSVFPEENIVAVRLIKQKSAYSCDCRLHQVCDVCQGVTANSPKLDKVFNPNDYLAGRDDAYLRFRQSPRGKEALAKIGKGDAPSYRALTDEGINSIAAAALVEHDRVWPVKKG